MRYATIPVLILAATGFVPGSLAAAELARSGPVDARYYSHNVQTIPDLETADGMKAYVNEAFVFHVTSPKGGLFDGTTARCVGYGSYHPETGAVREVGRCTLVDAAGDKFFDEYEIDVKGSGDMTPAKGRFLGGTGKYRGIKGTFTVTAEIWPAQGPTQTMWAGDVKGEYSLGD